MHCRTFREHHGDWVDDVVDPSLGERLAHHVAECATCDRFDTFARRALMVARNAPQIEVSSDFSARLAARIAEERRARIASHAPSHVERRRLPRPAGGMVWVRRAAAVTALLGGSALVRGALGTASDGSAVFPGAGVGSASPPSEGFPFLPATTALTGGSAGEIVVVRPMRHEGGSLLPLSDDPLLDGENNASLGEVHATTVAATAPLWPTALMAAHAAHRFAAMEFGDVIPVTMSQVRP